MLFAAALSVSAQAPSKEYVAAVARIQELSGTVTSSKVVAQQMVAMFKQQTPDTPDSFWDGFQKKCEEKFVSKMAEICAPIYQKYLTLDDLKQIIVFYESPIGKKLGATMPAIKAESIQLGQKLGMEIAKELQQELQTQQR